MSGTPSLLRVGTLTLGLASAAHAQCTPEKFVPGDGAIGDQFGFAVSVSGDLAIVGAPEDDDSGTGSGSAYVFQRLRGQWVQTAKLVPGDGATRDHFGCSVALSGDTALVGAYQDDDIDTDAGSVYVFQLVGGAWTQVAELYASDGENYDEFGTAVAIDGDTAVVGAPEGHFWVWSGHAYVFERVGGVWSQTARLSGSGGTLEHDNTGNAVAVSGDTILVGASGDDDLGGNAGSAYLWEKVGGRWTEVAKLTAASHAEGDDFGYSVSLSPDTAFVGVIGDDDLGADSGSVCVFEPVGGVWTQVGKLTASDGEVGDNFGCSVSVGGETAVIGARYDEDHGYRSGAAYIFEKIGGVWTEVGKVTSPDALPGERFGEAVSLDASTALMGAARCGTGAAHALDLPCVCPANFNGDYLLDTRDFLAFLNAWASGDSRADWDQNGTIDTQDVAAFLNDWVAGC